MEGGGGQNLVGIICYFSRTSFVVVKAVVLVGEVVALPLGSVGDEACVSVSVVSGCWRM